jgi:hypothetical protein
LHPRSKSLKINHTGKGYEKDDYMTEAQHSDALKNLVLFIIGLAILGTIIALALYFAVELPAQQAIALHPPANPVPPQIF